MQNCKSILIICSGNTCRSPMAKVILEERLKTEGLEKQIKVDSAAYGEPTGTSAHLQARQVIKDLYGEDLLAGHIPKKLTDVMVDEADLILVMEDYMKAGLPLQKVVVLDIPDPYNSGFREYGLCARALIQSVGDLKQKFDDLLTEGIA
jgi:protein-tyrosine-phosphatase